MSQLKKNIYTEQLDDDLFPQSDSGCDSDSDSRSEGDSGSNAEKDAGDKKRKSRSRCQSGSDDEDEVAEQEPKGDVACLGDSVEAEEGVADEDDVEEEDDVEAKDDVPAEEEEEVDEEEEEEDEEDINRPRKRKKHGRCGGFIIEEAEVDDEVDDDNDELEEGAQEIGIVSNEIDEVGPSAREIEESRRCKGNEHLKYQEEEFVDYLKQKYVDGYKITDNIGDGCDSKINDISQQSLLPTIKDPNLWLVKCKPGEEKLTALLLMRKFITYQSSEYPLVIKSVVVPEFAKGFIYVEAYKQLHVNAAIGKVGALKGSIWNQKMVPLNEMPDVLRVIKDPSRLKDTQWVRFRRGLFKDDIAQVDFVDFQNNKVYLKMLPRIDYEKPRGALRTVQSNADLKRKMKSRPAAKVFDPEAVRAIGGKIDKDAFSFFFEGNRYCHKGYLFKDFSINAVKSEGVKPTLSELAQFEESSDVIELENNGALSTENVLAAGRNGTEHTFSTGDKVNVCDGELTHLQGTILSVDKNKIMVMPKHNELSDPLEFRAEELKKHFSIGDHVQIVAGKYAGDTGLILRIETRIAFVFSDTSLCELEVLPKHLQMCIEKTSGVISLGSLECGDKVHLDSQTVGVIVRLERDNVHVLSMHGKIVESKPQALSIMRQRKPPMALDANQNAISKNNFVEVVEGNHKGRSGHIKHMYRSFAFVHSRSVMENGGIFVCKTRHLLLPGVINGIVMEKEKTKNPSWNPLGLDYGMPPPTHGMTSQAHGITSQTHGITSPTRGSRRQNQNACRGRQAYDHRRERNLIGKTVKIVGGSYKGHIGTAVDTYEDSIRVELHAICQKMLISKYNVIFPDEPAKDARFFDRSNKTPSYGNQTPMYTRDGARTPIHGSETPLYESSGSFTPGNFGAWDPSIPNTPVRRNDDDYSFEDLHNLEDFMDIEIPDIDTDFEDVDIPDINTSVINTDFKDFAMPSVMLSDIKLSDINIDFENFEFPEFNSEVRNSEAK